MNVRWVETRSPEWDAVLATVGGGDVFFSAAYHRACETDGRGRAALVVVEEGDLLLAQPLLVRPVDAVGLEATVGRGWSDAESAYGYTGPLASPDAGADFLAAAWSAYHEALAGRGIVAEFLRLHPYLGNVRLLPAEYRVFEVRRSVSVSLAGLDEDGLWSGYPSSQRNMVRRAGAAGLACRELPLAGPGAAVFHRLYEATMRRLGATPEYFFSLEYFEALAEGLGRRARLLVVEAGGAVVTAGLFLAGPEVLHYFLGAGDPELRKPGQGNLLLDAAARAGLREGLAALHLGGGRTAAPDDSLFRFKRTVSRETLPVHGAARVHDDSAYAALCSSWLAQAGTSERPPFHLLYRLPLPSA